MLVPCFTRVGARFYYGLGQVLLRFGPGFTKVRVRFY